MVFDVIILSYVIMTIESLNIFALQSIGKGEERICLLGLSFGHHHLPAVQEPPPRAPAGLRGAPVTFRLQNRDSFATHDPFTLLPSAQPYQEGRRTSE